MQVTNPAIDPFRESVVTSLRTFVGPEGDVSAVAPGHAYRLELEQPILTLTEMAAVKRMDFRGWHTNVIDVTYDTSMGDAGLHKSLTKICQAAERAISWGYQILVRRCRTRHLLTFARAPLIATCVSQLPSRARSEHQRVCRCSATATRARTTCP